MIKIKSGYRVAGLIASVAVLSVGGAIYVNKQSSPPNPLVEAGFVDDIAEPTTDNVKLAHASLAGGEAPPASLESVKFSTVLTTDVSQMSLPEQKALIQSRRDKIEVLMAELDKVRDNPTELNRIDSEIKRYIANYNQLLLPVIVAEQALKK